MLLALLLLGACDEAAVRHRGPIPASVRVRRQYKASGGRLGNVVDEQELVVEGYTPLSVGPCEAAGPSRRSCSCGAARPPGGRSTWESRPRCWAVPSPMERSRRP